jgi:transcriptional regulator with XRE-family HTH domain
MSPIVQKLRLQRGWSQQQLAELSDLSVRTVQRIEGGQNATVESLKSLAAVFEVDFQALRAAVEDSKPSAAGAPALQASPQPEPEIPTMSSPDQASFSSQAATASMRYRERLLAMPDDEVRAFREVKRLRGFYIHLMIYVLVITGLVILNLVRTPDRLWVLGPAFGWGIGILAHGLSVFGKGLVFGPEWERRQIEKRIGRKL